MNKLKKMALQKKELEIMSKVEFGMKDMALWCMFFSAFITSVCLKRARSWPFMWWTLPQKTSQLHTLCPETWHSFVLIFFRKKEPDVENHVRKRKRRKYKVQPYIFYARLVGLPYNESIVVRVTGCPNGCARLYMAELGLVGDGPNSYQIWLGGTPAQTSLANWRLKRKSKGSFGDFTNRVVR